MTMHPTLMAIAIPTAIPAIRRGVLLPCSKPRSSFFLPRKLGADTLGVVISAADFRLKIGFSGSSSLVVVVRFPAITTS
jgi:hypothetical protein